MIGYWISLWHGEFAMKRRISFCIMQNETFGFDALGVLDTRKFISDLTETFKFMVITMLILIIFTCVSAKFRRGHPCGGAKYRWGIKFAQFSTNKSLYLANDIRYGHGCYGRRIRNHTQAFEWHQFQWPWVTSFQGHDIIQRQITRKWYKIEL